MDSPSVDSPGSPGSSIDASEKRAGNSHVNTSKAIRVDESAMQVDENTPLAAPSEEIQRKRKSEAAAKDGTVDDKKGKKAASPKILQSSRDTDLDDASDEEVVVVSSRQVKRPKLADAPGKESSSTPARQNTATTSKSITTLPSSSAVKDATESHIVQFKNGKLLLKQKKIDFSQQNAALQKRIEWNGFMEDVEDSSEVLDAVPTKFYALIALMIYESDKSRSELAKSVKNALNPPLTGDEDSQSSENVDKLPLNVIGKAIDHLAERVNHGFRDNPSKKEDIVTIEDSDDDESGGKDSPSGSSKEDRDLPKEHKDVPNGLRLYRWEVKPDLRKELFQCLPRDMQEKIEVRVEERLTVRDEAKKLLAAMSKAEQKEIYLKGVKTNDGEASTSKEKTLEKGKGKEKADKKAKSSNGDKPVSKAKKVKEEEDDEGDKPSIEEGKGKAAHKAKELTEGEKQQKEEEKLKKEQEKAEKEKKRIEREAAKAIKEAAKAEKDAIKAEKDAAKAKIEQAKKQQKNAFGAWLAKAGTSPVEVLNKPGSVSSHNRQMSSSSSSEAGSMPPVEQKKGDRVSRDYYSTFRPFYVRAGVEVAPVNRFLATKSNNVKKEETDDTQPEAPSELTKENSLKDFLSRAALDRIPSSSKSQIQPISSIMTAMQESEISGDMESYHKLRTQLRNTDKYPFKLLKFHVDVRPGYLGTWTKSSSTISGRNPYGRDTSLLDYDYDSEAEWDEDPEDAEDIKEDSGEEEMSESEDDLDGWLAGDDEVEFEAGYDGELSLADRMDDVTDPFAQFGQGKSEDSKKKPKKSGKPTIKKKKITGPLIPIIKGPYWQDEDKEEADMSALSNFMTSFKISWLGQNECGSTDPFAHIEKRSKTAYNASIKTSTVTMNGDGLSKIAKPVTAAGPMLVKKPEVPKQLLDTFKKIVLSSTSTNKPLLLEELFSGLQGTEHKVSKSMIDRTLTSLVDRKKKAAMKMAEDGSNACIWEIKQVESTG